MPGPHRAPARSARGAHDTLRGADLGPVRAGCAAAASAASSAAASAAVAQATSQASATTASAVQDVFVDYIADAVFDQVTASLPFGLGALKSGAQVAQVSVRVNELRVQILMLKPLAA